MHLKLLNRVISKGVMSSLSELILNSDLNDSEVFLNKYFKNFVEASYKVKREQRPSVSQLADMFRSQKCSTPGTIATKYAIQLENLAFIDGIAEFRV